MISGTPNSAATALNMRASSRNQLEKVLGNTGTLRAKKSWKARVTGAHR